MTDLNIQTNQKRQVIDITDQVDELVKGDGLVTIFVAHTTCAVTTADLDPGTDLDLLDAVAAMVPKLKYRHPHDPGHVGDHILASLVGPSLTVPVANGQLVLGQWQRIVLIEFDGPRLRQLRVEQLKTS